MVSDTGNTRKKEVDIINDVLEECIRAFPVSSFIISLYKQYMQRGSLSKKQLQGLHSKASSIMDIPPNKLATIEAIIKKMPTRNRSELPENKPMFMKDPEAGRMIDTILARYPEHKRVIFLRSKYENNEPLSVTETDELKKFAKLIK